MSKVTVIPATVNPATKMPTLTSKKRKVCGYARVSTDKDEQFSSYTAQVDYYTKYIANNPDWEFVKVYTDEGISGTNTKKRDGFNQMIKDALDGKIDLILTKSVSRFARNTVDSLVTIRQLKEKGIEVFFEKENIWTLDSKGELLLTIMSSLAQEESRSISENITWGKRKSAADGKISLGYSQFLGYDKGPNGTLTVNPEQALIVKRIYREFMQGKAAWAIADGLTADGIPTPSQKTKQWSLTTVRSILRNEKYKGAALLQKNFTVDFLTKKVKANEGELPQYYVENSHEAIIPPAEWERVQVEYARRHSLSTKYSGKSIFSTKIVCEQCDAFFGPKIWSSNTHLRRKVWQCNAKFDRKTYCNTPYLTEDAIKAAFVEVVTRLFCTRDEVITNCETELRALTDCTAIEREQSMLQEELEVVINLTQKYVDKNATSEEDQGTYLRQYNEYVERYQVIKERLLQLNTERSARIARSVAFEDFLHSLRSMENAPVEFDESMWRLLVEKVVVKKDGFLKFVFTNGMEVVI